MGIFTKDTKTASSTRPIKLPAAAFSLLREHRTWQSAERLKIGDQWENTDRLFTQWNGKPLHTDSLTGWFNDFIKRTDLPHIHIHSLRHTNASLLIAGGINPRTVSKRLGHAQATTTMNIYSHAIQSADGAASQTLENILDPLGEKPKMG